MNNTIPFLQYLRPNGDRLQQFFDCEEGLARKAQVIIDRGYRFECEVLRTGEVSLTIYDGEADRMNTEVHITISKEEPTSRPAVNRYTKLQGEH